MKLSQFLTVILLALVSQNSFAALLPPITCHYSSRSGESGWIKFVESGNILTIRYTDQERLAKIIETNEDQVVGQYEVKGAGPFPGQTITIKIYKRTLQAYYKSSSANPDNGLTISDCAID